MKLSTLFFAVACAAGVTLARANPAPPDIVIGDLDDLSGIYADVAGQGAVEAIRMAIADFGGAVLGRKITVLVADHQNKPDIGASKFREWADQNGLNVLFGGSNTGVSIAMAKVAAAKKVPFFAIGAGGASLTNEDCTAYTVHYVYDTTALANGTATTIVQSGGKTWFYLTADYAFGTQLQSGGIQGGRGQRRQERRRGARAAVGLRLLLLPAAGAGLGRAGAGVGERRR